MVYFNEVFQWFFLTRCNNWKFFLPVNTEFVPFWLGSISGRPCDSDSTKIIKRGKWRQFVFHQMLRNNMLSFFVSVGPSRVYNQAQWHNGSSILNIDAGILRQMEPEGKVQTLRYFSPHCNMMDTNCRTAGWKSGSRRPSEAWKDCNCFLK